MEQQEASLATKATKQALEAHADKYPSTPKALGDVVKKHINHELDQLTKKDLKKAQTQCNQKSCNSL